MTREKIQRRKMAKTLINLTRRLRENIGASKTAPPKSAMSMRVPAPSEANKELPVLEG